VHPDDLAGAEEAVRESLETGQFESEWRTTTPGGEERWIAGRGWVQHDRQGRPVRMIGMNIDVTERRRHEEQMRTVMAELNHRVKNTLAVIQSIAQQTMRRADTLESFAGRFLPRIHSMARAHSLLTQSEWAGAELRDILESEIEPRAAASDRYALQGPSVSFRPQTALTMHMIVHELATNAIKHGALAAPRGHVEVRWSVERDAAATLALDWVEEGVARAQENGETAEGYGSELIRQLLEYELRGVMHSEMTPRGMRHRFRFPLRAGDAPAVDLPIRLHVAPASASARVLVVEDSYALAMTLRDELENVGFAVLGPCGALSQARELAADEEFDFAVLDVDLGGELVYPLARDLQEREIPFLLLTGFNRQDLARDLRDVPLLNKPVEHGRVAEAVSAALAPAPAVE
jgi:two-component sensor histidine kinase